ncbi:MAG: DUF4232 domain-containing protein [Solirubrobacteraceae bacterium]
MRLLRARLTWPTAVVAAVVVAGCGSAAPGGARPSSAASEANPSGASLVQGLVSAQNALRARIARSGCRSGRITVSTGEGGAGLGHVGLPLLFRNTGRATCIMTGYPAATLVTAGGHRVAARRTRGGYLGGLVGAARSLPVVRVGPGAAVSAYLEGLDFDPAHGGGSCPTYPRLLVTAPNQTLTFRLLSPVSQICRPEVHPLVAGTSGRSS